MKQLTHCLIVVSTLLLHGACSRKTQVNTATLEIDIRIAYENCLRDEAGAFEFNSQNEFISKLEGRNAHGIRYLGLSPDMLDQDGQVIDEWGRPLRITRPEKTRLEIRSAGRDGKFDTQDDIVTLHPRVKDH